MAPSHARERHDKDFVIIIVAAEVTRGEGHGVEGTHMKDALFTRTHSNKTHTFGLADTSNMHALSLHKHNSKICEDTPACTLRVPHLCPVATWQGSEVRMNRRRGTR